MKMLLVSAAIWALGLCLVAPLQAADKQDLDKRIQEVNALATKPDIALKTIANETGMPLERLKQQHQKHPDVGVAGLMIANVINNDTKKGPETYLSQKESGKSWVQIARDSKIPLQKLTDRLDRFEQALKGGK